MVWKALAKWFVYRTRSLDAQRYVPALGDRGVSAWFVATTIPLPGGGMLVFPLSEVFVNMVAAEAAWHHTVPRFPQAAVLSTKVLIDPACDDHGEFMRRHQQLQTAAAERGAHEFC